MSLDTATRDEVFPCRACSSPVFDDEAYCEACGTAVATSSAGDLSATSQGVDGREERDLGVAASITDRGHRRKRNEDAFALAASADTFVAVVCDGVASTANPDQAARAAADATLGVLQALLAAPTWPESSSVESLFDQAFGQAQAAVLRVPDDEPDGNDLSPSTTLVAAVGTAERIVVGNVGDSRAYWLSAGDASHHRVLTVDDSVVQERIADGVPPEVAQRDPDAHTITRWIGGDTGSIEPRVVFFDVVEAGVLLVCTDGLWNYFPDLTQLAEVVFSGSTRPLEVANRLVDAALHAGGADNITVAVVPVDPTPFVAPGASAPRGKGSA
jgi:serine/threonine protein phosphatase PrpC